MQLRDRRWSRNLNSWHLFNCNVLGLNWRYNSSIIASYLANLSGITGSAVTVFASGYRGGLQPGFEVWVALADGTTFPLPQLVRTNELEDKLEALQLSPNPTISDLFVRFELNETEALRYGIRDLTGRLVIEGDFGPVNTGEFVQKLDVSMLPAGMYALEIVSDAGVRAMKFVVQE